jgi:hypothetical protein
MKGLQKSMQRSHTVGPRIPTSLMPRSSVRDHDVLLEGFNAPVSFNQN